MTLITEKVQNKHQKEGNRKPTQNQHKGGLTCGKHTLTFGQLMWAGFETFPSKMIQLRLRDNGRWGSLNHSVTTV